MGTIRLNIKPVQIYAVSDTFQTTDLTNNQIIDVLLNDYQGITPTVIESIDLTGFTLGDVSINMDNTLTFKPSGTLGTSTFKYTIKDSINRLSTTSVYVTTTA